MNGSVICKAYKLNREYIIREGIRVDGTNYKRSIDKGRIFLRTIYFDHKGREHVHDWLLATPIKPAELNFDFTALQKGQFIDEINIEDEHYWINNHLNKQVRFYLRQSKYLTRNVLFEKYKHKSNERLKINTYPISEKPSLIRKLANFFFS